MQNMNMNAAIVFGDAETLIELDQRSVSEWALNLTLLVNGLIDTLSIRDKKYAIALSVKKERKDKRSRFAKVSSNNLKCELSLNEAEYLQVFLLRTYRDGVAEVNHIHIESDLGGSAHDLTILFENARPPMSPEEAAALLKD